MLFIRLLLLLPVCVLLAHPVDVSNDDNAEGRFGLNHLKKLGRKETFQQILKFMRRGTKAAQDLDISTEITLLSHGVEVLLDKKLKSPTGPEIAVLNKISEEFEKAIRNEKHHSDTHMCMQGLTSYAKYHKSTVEWMEEMENLYAQKDAGKVVKSCEREGSGDFALLVDVFSPITGKENIVAKCLGAKHYSEKALAELKAMVEDDAMYTSMHVTACNVLHHGFNNETVTEQNALAIDRILEELDEYQRMHAFDGIKSIAVKFFENNRKTLTAQKAVQEFTKDFLPNWSAPKTAYMVQFLAVEDEFERPTVSYNPKFAHNVLIADVDPRFVVNFYKTNATEEKSNKNRLAFNSLNSKYKEPHAFLDKKIAESKDKKFYQSTKIRISTKEIVEHIYGSMYPFPYISAAVVANKESLGETVDPRAGVNIVKAFECKLKNVKNHNGVCFLSVTIGF